MSKDEVHLPEIDELVKAAIGTGISSYAAAMVSCALNDTLEKMSRPYQDLGEYREEHMTAIKEIERIRYAFYTVMAHSFAVEKRQQEMLPEVAEKVAP